LGLPASREPIMTSWPIATNFPARVCPTIPVPRTAIFMRALLIIGADMPILPLKARPAHPRLEE